MERREHGKPADELGDEPRLEQILGEDLLQELAHKAHLLIRDLRAEAEAMLARASLDDLIEPDERSSADEEDIRGVDLQKFLLRMFAAALGRDVRDRPLDDLEQGLLHAFAAHIARDGRVIALPRDLIDLIDIDDAALGALDVMIRVLKELDDDIFNVLAHITRLSERRRVRNGKGHIQDARERLREEGLTRACRPEEQDIRFRELDIVGARRFCIDPLVVIMHRDREHLLGAILANDVFVEDRLDLGRGGQGRALRERLVALHLFGDNIVTQTNALIADIDIRPSDELFYFLLRFPAEGALEIAMGIVSSAVHKTPKV